MSFTPLNRFHIVLIVGINVNLIIFITFYFADADDEGIERDSEDLEEDKHFDTKDLDHVLQVSDLVTF